MEMVSLDEAIKIILAEETQPLTCVFETNLCYYFGYGNNFSDGYYMVNKETGKPGVFFPQDDFNEFDSMRLIKKL